MFRILKIEQRGEFEMTGEEVSVRERAGGVDSLWVSQRVAW